MSGNSTIHNTTQYDGGGIPLFRMVLVHGKRIKCIIMMNLEILWRLSRVLTIGGLQLKLCNTTIKEVLRYKTSIKLSIKQIIIDF